MTRPEQLLSEFGARHPGIWKYADECRALHGKVHDWPEWCFLPVSATYSYVMEEMILRYDASSFAELAASIKDDPLLTVNAYDAGMASVFAAWRMGRGIYHFDPDFATALTETPVDGDLPVELFFRLPEWAVYVSFPDPESGIFGFFAALEWDISREVPEMRLFFDVGDQNPVLYPLELNKHSIAEMLDASWDNIRRNSHILGTDPEVVIDGFFTDPTLAKVTKYALPKAVNLLLYLCSSEPDYRGTARPHNPTPVKTKKGPRIFPAATARVWEIGQKTGDMLRKARKAPAMPEERSAPRPHLRRAHWHTYRVGEKRQGYRVRWLHPILVGKIPDE